jgi:hypothetical protein
MEGAYYIKKTFALIFVLVLQTKQTGAIIPEMLYRRHSGRVHRRFPRRSVHGFWMRVMQHRRRSSSFLGGGMGGMGGCERGVRTRWPAETGISEVGTGNLVRDWPENYVKMKQVKEINGQIKEQRKNEEWETERKKEWMNERRKQRKTKIDR